jgi:hypothetical protein
MKTLSLLGNITRETSREALREILRRNLRIDYNARGEREGGRAAIVADPFNPGDHISNMFRQRVQGQVRVVVDKDRWWGDIGEQADETVGVALSVAGAGAVIFSNTVYNMPAVILADFSEAIYVHSRWEKRALKNVEVAHSDHVAKCGGHSSAADNVDLIKEYNIEWSKMFDGKCAINSFVTEEERIITNQNGESFRAGYEYISTLPNRSMGDFASAEPKLAMPTTDDVKISFSTARARLTIKLTMLLSWLTKAL